MEKTTNRKRFRLRQGAATIQLAALVVLGAVNLYGQRELAGAAALKESLDRLQVVGSVLMIAAHPDDENTAFLAYCSKGRNLRTAYLSLTRGEGGQNLIGSEQGALLGMIRTQELLAARRIDGAEQFFTRAIDFGFSKTADETLRKWNREQVLSDIVWVIRKFQPDVIVLRFSGTARDGHGHHQSSSILGREAFRAAADPNRFPEQLKYVEPWQARRVVWNAFAFTREQEKEAEALKNRVSMDLGEYDPVLGYSYSEIAGMSRSQHRSQGMGAPERKGSQINQLATVEGQPATQDLFDEVDTTWKRIPGSEAVAAALEEAQKAYDVRNPAAVIPPLLKARAALEKLTSNSQAARKLEELDNTIALAAGVWVDVNAGRPTVVPGDELPLQLSALSRVKMPVALVKVDFEGMTPAPVFSTTGWDLEYNKPRQQSITYRVPANQPYSQPIWLREAPKETMYTLSNQQEIGLAEGPAPLVAVLRVRIGSQEIVLKRPVENRYVDRVRGELHRPLVIAPPVSLSVMHTALLFPDGKARNIEVGVRANKTNASGTVRLQAPAGWQVKPESLPFSLADVGQMGTLVFTVTPPSQAGRTGTLLAVAKVGDTEVAQDMETISYEHIPPQTLFPAAETRIIRDDVRVTAKRIGYVMGAGDEIPESLRQLGCEVVLLDRDDLTRGDLARYDAIVTGVRAWNVREDLRANHARLHDYVAAGGTLITQFNTTDGGPFATDANPALKNIGPYPIRIARGRVAEEEAHVTVLQPGHPLLLSPNKITPADFAGWVQERGVYFASEWDPRYQALFAMNDAGEKPLQGGLLTAKHGKGTYVFTGLAFFRQLPAGVPGAYRLFANLISGGKAQ